MTATIKCKGHISLVEERSSEFCPFGTYQVFAGSICIGKFIPMSEHSAGRLQNSFDLAAEEAIDIQSREVERAKKLRLMIREFLWPD
jgi:hypothetical protein